MAMANSRYIGDKYIIIGIKDKPEGKEIKGINKDEFVDSSIYNQIISSNLEPEIEFNYFKFEMNGKILGVFQIYNTTDKPYMLRKKYSSLNERLCYIRKGSTNSLANRRDYDYMYEKKGEFKVSLRDNTLFATNDIESCASIEVYLSNTSKLPITIIRGYLDIINKENEVLTRHSVFGIDTIEGADFTLALSPHSERVGSLWVNFTSSDPLRLNIDEYGISNREFLFKLVLINVQDEEFISVVDGANIIVRGDFLWKVKKNKGIPHKFRGDRFSTRWK